jgi:hypothetical protein
MTTEWAESFNAGTLVCWYGPAASAVPISGTVPAVPAPLMKLLREKMEIDIRLP